jgi:hypothetical protein
VDTFLVTGSGVGTDSSAQALAITTSVATTTVPDAVIVVSLDIDNIMALVENRTCKNAASILSPVFSFWVGAAR